MSLEGTPSRRPRPFQFGIASILVLTTIGAVVIGIGRAMNTSLEAQLLVCGYIFVMLVYMFLRVPYLWRLVFGKDSDWQRARQKREELEASARREPDDSQTSS